MKKDIPIIIRIDEKIGEVVKKETVRNKKTIQSRDEVLRKRYKRKKGPIGDTETMFTVSHSVVARETQELFEKLGIDKDCRAIADFNAEADRKREAREKRKENKKLELRKKYLNKKAMEFLENL